MLAIQVPNAGSNGPEAQPSAQQEDSTKVQVSTHIRRDLPTAAQNPKAPGEDIAQYAARAKNEAGKLLTAAGASPADIAVVQDLIDYGASATKRTIPTGSPKGPDEAVQKRPAADPALSADPLLDAAAVPEGSRQTSQIEQARMRYPKAAELLDAWRAANPIPELTPMSVEGAKTVSQMTSLMQFGAERKILQGNGAPPMMLERTVSERTRAAIFDLAS